MFSSSTALECLDAVDSTVVAISVPASPVSRSTCGVGIARAYSRWPATFSQDWCRSSVTITWLAGVSCWCASGWHYSLSNGSRWDWNSYCDSGWGCGTARAANGGSGVEASWYSSRSGRPACCLVVIRHCHSCGDGCSTRGVTGWADINIHCRGGGDVDISRFCGPWSP